MKKLLYTLFAVCLFTACSSDDDTPTPTTEPQKGDAVTTEQIVGTYRASEIKYDNNDFGFFDDKIELTFKADNTGEEWNPRTLAKTPFTWSYNSTDRVISFSYSLHQNVKGWFDNSKLKYRDYVKNNGVTSKSIATHDFVKVKSSISAYN